MTEQLIPNAPTEQDRWRKKVEEVFNNSGIRLVAYTETSAWGERGAEIFFSKVKRGRLLTVERISKRFFTPATPEEIAQDEADSRELANTLGLIDALLKERKSEESKQ